MESSKGAFKNWMLKVANGQLTGDCLWYLSVDIARHVGHQRKDSGSPPPPSPPPPPPGHVKYMGLTVCKFDDVPGVAKQRSQARTPCQLFAGSGCLPPFAENLEKLFVVTWENGVFGGKYRAAKGTCKEVQGSRGEEIKGPARTCSGQEVDMTGKQGELKGKRRGTERDMGKERKQGGRTGKQRTRKPKDTKGDVGK